MCSKMQVTGHWVFFLVYVGSLVQLVQAQSDVKKMIFISHFHFTFSFHEPTTTTLFITMSSATGANPVIDLSNDDSPDKPKRQPGSIMDDMRNYGQVQMNGHQATAASSAVYIDLANDDASSPSNKQTSQSIPNPYKRKRLENTNSNVGKSERSKDGGLITTNLVDLLDKFRSNNILTINPSGTSHHTTQSSTNGERHDNPRQPLHYTQQDKWTCGFRNLQMLISSMPTNITNTIFPEGIPTLHELQTSFELLWAEGFDPNGANHHNFKMVGKSGKCSWIGAVEVWSYLVFRGIDATVVQFANTMRNRSAVGPFVWAYFSRLGPDCDCHSGQGSRSQKVSYQYTNELIQAAKQIQSSTEETPCLISCSCTLCPLYLQWSGHSVTIVGIRRERIITSNTGIPSMRYHLIVFDPQKNGDMLRNKLTSELSKGPEHDRQPNCLNFMELSTEKLLSKDTQILLSTARVISDQERERCKERVSCVSVVI